MVVANCTFIIPKLYSSIIYTRISVNLPRNYIAIKNGIQSYKFSSIKSTVTVNPIEETTNSEKTEPISEIKSTNNAEKERTDTAFSYHVQNGGILKKCVSSSLAFMEEISHMDDVRVAHNKVMLIKDNLKKSGDIKRDILFELNIIRQNIQKNHNEICNTMRGTERYLTLVKEEVSLINNEHKKQNEFNITDETERQLFNNLTTAINDSYEKEKIHANFIKILGLLGTLVASFISLILAAIGHFYHNTKFGLVAKDFKDSVNKTIQFEIGNMKDDLRNNTAEVAAQQKLLKELLKNQESWMGYFQRHTVNVYRYFIPKSKP